MVLLGKDLGALRIHASHAPCLLCSPSVCSALPTPDPKTLGAAGFTQLRLLSAPSCHPGVSSTASGHF